MAETIDEAYRNGRVVLDVTMSSDKVIRIDEMNGHQGDNGRVVKFVMIGQQGRPFNMQNRSLDLVGVDSAGKTKISGNTMNIISPSLGKLDFTIPGAFYQRVGDYDRAYFRIKDNNDQVISTINVMFSVIQGVGYMTQGDSQIFDGNVENNMARIEQKVANFTKELYGMLDGTNSAAKIARESLNAVLSSIQANQVATKGGNNVFTGQNTFHGTTQIDKLSGNALQPAYDYANNAINAAKASLADNESGKQYEYKAWGVNGCRAHNDVRCTLIKFNKYVGYCKLEGTFDFPAMKPYESREVINVDQAAMNGGIYAFPRLTPQNENNVLMFEYNTGDSGHIWMHHQSNSYDATKPDSEYIQIGWFCSWR
ncbi:BppU family phage baseplate upper protein [Limosilactobacillus sp. STM2_1]|uniref:BppU family phage baseplate upper protein n=1 Tax=Limosilactobacillus rudii TaxID=2759755 RepID=A0A7W3UK18_9LACO|nr:BppU family phage baseplate upper protein [Limosilactobacillus rudii]MBB1079077.1 BppU family phage baseplate upper protein [Limosilactobacillus rudii]MBB1097048.1 BppU family phage baseplate upper protein [Limosilactobacillus rudii]MCD7134016.1 phage baseplate upper protein [Limosilactobacillus rudii]